MQFKVLEDLDFTKRGGLLPVIVQDQITKDILMLAYVNREALENIQPVEKILVDCDADALLYVVNSNKPICHTGNTSCFHNVLKDKNY